MSVMNESPVFFSVSDSAACSGAASVVSVSADSAASAPATSALAVSAPAASDSAVSACSLEVVPEEFRRELVHVRQSFKTFMRGVLAPICQRYDMTPQQMYILTELLEEPGQSAGQLSDRSGILRTNFSSVCHKLEGRGLIRRERSDKDRRAFELYITDEGRLLLDCIDDDIRHWCTPVADSEYSEILEAVKTIMVGFRSLSELSRRLAR